MKRTLICLSAFVAIGGIAWFGSSAEAQTPMGNPPAASAQPMRPRIALVNIAKVLREYNKANADGQAITKVRQKYVDQVKPLREMLAVKTRAIQSSNNPVEKEKLQKDAIALNRQIEDLDQQAQRELGDMTDRTIVEVYQNIKTVINDIAVTNNLDLVMCYPDSSSADDDKKPAIAQIKLQTPALIPFYQRGMDITEVVVVTLNRRHPAPPVTGVAPPMGNVVPVKGP